MSKLLDPSGPLSRRQRRALRSHQRHKGHLPGAARDHDTIDRAYEIATEKFGIDRLSGDHAKAFMYLVGRLTHFANGYYRERERLHPSTPLRRAYGLSAGGGKTLSALSWIAAVYETGKTWSVAYAASEVEALCGVKRQLVADFGVPSDKIGLLHSYTYDPDKAADGIPGYASEPATPDDQLHTKQFLLVSHQLVNTGTRALARYNTYGPDRRPRDLVIYDETLLVSEASSLQLKDIKHGADWLATEMEYGSSSTKDRLKIAHGYVQDCQRLLRKVSDGKIHLPALCDDGEPLDPQTVIDRLPRKCPDAVRVLLRGHARPVRVLSGRGSAAIFWVQKVPDELRTVFVLDASHAFRALPRLQDINVRQDIGDVPSVVIDYTDLTVETFRHPAGRASIEDECRKPWSQRSLARKIADWIKGLPADELCLVWTFKQRDTGPNIPARLVQTLEQSGCDMSRVKIVTHGRARGSNEFENFGAVAWYGILEQDRADVTARMFGELRDYDADIWSYDPAHVHAREILHELYQESQRCRVRHVAHGRAGKAAMFVPCWHLDVVRELVADHACPGATLIHRADLEPDFVRDMLADSKTATVAAAILDELRAQPGDVNRVSGKALKPAVERRLGEVVSKRVWELSVARAAQSSELELAGWRRDGRSFVRTRSA